MVKKITLSLEERLESFLDVDEDITGLVYLEDENPTNILLFKSIFDTLTKSSPHDLTFGISKKFDGYVKLFGSKNVKCMSKVKPKEYDYMFLVPNSELKYKKKKNAIRDLNRSFIGLTNVRFSPAKVSIKLDNENSDIILADLSKDHVEYENIVNELEDRGLELLNVRDAGTPSVGKGVRPARLLNATDKRVNVSGNGFIPFDTEFKIKDTDTVEGKVYPQASSVLKYVNKNGKKTDDVAYDITGKGMVGYEFKVNVMSNELSIEIYLDDFSIKSGISSLISDQEDEEELSTDVDVTESIVTSHLFMGESGVNLLLAYSILGISKCVLLSDSTKRDDYFKNENYIDISNYKKSTAGDLIEDMYTSEI